MKKVENKMEIRTFTFGDLTVYEIPTVNYNPNVKEEIIYTLAVTYHRPFSALYEVCGVYEQFPEEHITNMYLNGYFDGLDEEE